MTFFAVWRIKWPWTLPLDLLLFLTAMHQCLPLPTNGLVCTLKPLQNILSSHKVPVQQPCLRHIYSVPHGERLCHEGGFGLFSVVTEGNRTTKESWNYIIQPNCNVLVQCVATLIKHRVKPRYKDKRRCRFDLLLFFYHHVGETACDHVASVLSPNTKPEVRKRTCLNRKFPNTSLLFRERGSDIAIGQKLRVICLSLTSTKSPTWRFLRGSIHFCLFCNKGKYSRLRVQN